MIPETDPGTERRVRRAVAPHIALSLQLSACCTDGLVAMVLATGDGLALARAGDPLACEEVAAKMAIIARKIRDFSGTLLGDGAQWEVQMSKFEVDGAELVLCAVGGEADVRRRQLARSIECVQRILAQD